MELEAKYLIDSPERAKEIVALLRNLGYKVGPARPKSIEDHYCDTPRWRLARRGWAFRIRALPDQSILTLKSLGKSEQALHEREEFEQSTGAELTDLRRLPKGGVQEKLHAWTGKRKLIERFRIVNQREIHIAHCESSGAKLEIAIDQAAVHSDAGTLEFRELEIELLEGTRKALEDITAAIAEKLQCQPARQSKFERGLALIGARPGKPHRKSVDPEQTLAEFAYSVLQQRFGDLLFEEPRACEGLHPEGVHQVRIATRRIRAALRVFRDVLPTEASKTFRAEFRWLASALAEVRDLDVYRANLDRFANELVGNQSASLDIYRHELARQWAAARSTLVDALGSERYRQLVGGFAKFLESGPSEEAQAESESCSLRRAARRRVRKAVRKFLKHCSTVSDQSPDEEVHQLRLRGKKLRYLLEIFRRVPGVEIGGPLRALKKLQDVLGDHQDACVATERLEAFAASLPLAEENRETLFALGRLAQRQQAITQRSRAALNRVLRSFHSKAKALG